MFQLIFVLLLVLFEGNSSGFEIQQDNAAGSVLDNPSFSGRWDKSGKYPVSQWPGSGISIDFQTAGGDEASVTLIIDGCEGDCKFYLDAKAINGCQGTCYSENVFKTFEVNAQTKSVTISVEPERMMYGYGPWLIEFRKLTEGSCADAEGVFSISDIQTASGSVAKSVAPRLRQVLFIGDSITAAYGVDGPEGCSFDAEYENIEHSYAYLAMLALRLEAQYVAFSGKGVVRNYNDSQTTSADPMPVYYNRTLTTDPSSYYDPNQSRFEVVVVALGSNDYSTTPYPSDDDFINAYAELLTQVNKDYPDAKILCICEPLPGGNEEQNVQKVASMFGAEYLRIPDSIYGYGTGCDGHPNQAGQKAISSYVIPVLKAMLL